MMGSDNDFRFYTGEGRTLRERNIDLPAFEPLSSLDHPQDYLAEKGLRDAVNVALALGQPLLVTGEPGTGKTQLGGSIAYEFELPLPYPHSKPFVFHTKTTSHAKDLFYRYDALGHFHDSQFQSEAASPERYISYEALGLAILLSLDKNGGDTYLPEQWKGKGPVKTVVLIDEIDKAPRDLPNDILHEIERLSFTVTETRTTFEADKNYRPFVIFTSNSEKDLPDAFLRRCVFYHIAFPDSGRLKEIVKRRLKLSSNFTPEMLDNAVTRFEEIRKLGLKKSPATAELLGWMKILARLEIDVKNPKPGEAEALAFSYSALAKTKEDLERLQKS
jgi:MoxR-like ATPase